MIKCPTSVFVVRTLLAAAATGLAMALFSAPKPWAIDLSAFEKLPIPLCIQTGLWWAGLANAALFLALALTAPLWLRPLSAPPPAAAAPLPRGFWRCVLAAMAVFAGVGAMRLPFSLWDDEEYSARKVMVGTWREKPNGALEFKQVGWEKTLWYYQTPANHGLQSVLSRLSSSCWRILARPQGLQFSETALRLPGFLVSIAAIGALALLVARVGYPWAGVLAAWLLAIHPWFLRLGSEARGYPFVFLFVPVLLLAALRCGRTGAWTAFFALAAAEFLLLFTWPGAAFIVIILNLGVPFLLFARPDARQAAGVLIGRWLVTGSLAAGVLLTVTGPWLPQLALYLSAPPALEFGLPWLKTFGSLLLAGSQWSESRLGVSPYLELYPRWLAEPVLLAGIMAVAALLAAAGLVRFLRDGMSTRVTAAVLTLPALVLYAITKWKDGHLHEWYLAFLLPGLLAFIAVGACILTEKLRWRWRFASPALAVALIAGYAAFTWNERVFLLKKSAEPFRESVQAIRPSLDPNTPENRNILTASWLLTPEIYDPRVRRLKSADELTALMKEADERGIPLFVNNGHDLHNHDAIFPGLALLVRNPRLFEPVAMFQGLEPVFDRTIHRYRPGSLGRGSP